MEELVRVDRLLSATRLTRELRHAAAATGRRFLASVDALGIEDALLAEFYRRVREGGSPGNSAVGYGVASRALGAGLPEALHAYLFSAAATLVAAGQKLVPLGGSAAQRVLRELGAEIGEAAEASAGVEADDLYAFAPEIDVRSMLHERQRVRLYMS